MENTLSINAIFKSCTIGIMVLKPLRDRNTGKTIDFVWEILNDKGYEILRRNRSIDLSGSYLRKTMPEFGKKELFDKFSEVIESGKSIECDYEWQTINGGNIYLYLEIVKEDDSVLVIFQDHTRFKVNELQIKENEERYKKAEAIAHIGSWELDVKTNESYWSDEMYRIFGYEEPFPDVPEYDERLQLVHPEDRKETLQTVESAVKDNIKYRKEKRILRRNGEVRWVISEAEPLTDQNGNVVKLVGYYLDITERKKKETEILVSEKLFRSLFEGAGIGIAMVGADLNLFRVNNKLASMLGYSKDELIHMSIEDLTYPEDLNKDMALTARLINREIETYEIEKRYITKDGSVFWGLLTVSALMKENNEVDFLIGMIQDINQKKSAESKLKESERRFKALFNSTFQFAGLMEPDGTLIEANQTALNFGGFEAKDVIGRPFWEAN